MLKRTLNIFLIGTLLTTNLLGMSGRAAAASDVKISIQPEPVIDLALAVGSNAWDISNFEKDLKSKLQTKGINPGSVNIQALETSNVSTSDESAATIFNSWKKYPLSGAGMFLADWKLSGDQLYTTANVHWTGFWDPDKQNTTNQVIQFNTQSSDADPWGFTFRMTSSAYDNYSFYALEWSPNNQILTLAKITSWVPNSNDPVHGGPLYHGVVNASDGYYSKDSSYYANGFGGSLTNASGKVLQRISFPVTSSSWYDTKIDVTGNRIQVWVNGAKQIDVTDTSNPLSKGSYGPYAASNPRAFFKDVRVTSEVTKKFTEVIRQPIWRDNSERFVVNLENNAIAELDNAQASAEILTRLLNEEVHYVALGTSTNKTQAERFVTRNNNRGTYIDNANYQTAMENLATYIYNQYKARQTNATYLLAGEPINLNVNPTSFKTNTQTAEYPNGRWMVDHDYTYFENNLGQAPGSGTWQKDMPLNFDQPGKYEIWFGSGHPDPQYIYVHRRPIADYEMKVTKGSNYSVSLQDRSYDPDKQSTSTKGITTKEWSWRETTATAWTPGQPPATLPVNKDYIVQLRVQDEQGAWSKPVAKYVSTGSAALQPISDFQLPEKVTNVKTFNTIDGSYDPTGRTLTQKIWTVLKDGKSVYSGSQMITSFKPYGVGNYVVKLKVMNDASLWSEEFQKTIQVVNDTQGPSVSFSPNEASWTKPGLTAGIDFADDSGVSKTFYKVTSSAAVPSAWDTGGSLEHISLQLNTEGEWFIHAKAEDVAGNLTISKAGPFQIQSVPDVPVLKVSQVSDISAEISWTLPNKPYLDGYQYIVKNTVTNKTWTVNYPTDRVLEDRLEPGTKYTYTAQVKNNAGSMDSKALEVLTLPAAPENVVTTFEDHRSDKVKISFDPVKSATSYELALYKASSTGQVKVSDMTWNTAGEHEIKDLDAGTQYFFSLQAKNGTGLGIAANSGFLSLPAGPGEFKTVHVTDNSVSLDWQASKTATNYQLDRDTVEVYSGTELDHIDTGLDSATMYNYQLAAKNASGFGDVSNLDVLTLPGETKVQVVQIGSETLDLSWYPVRGSDRYVVMIDGIKEAEVPAGKESIQLDSLSPGTSYEVVVKAENSSGFGGYIPIQTITLPSVPDHIQVNHMSESKVKVELAENKGADRYKALFRGEEIEVTAPYFELDNLTGDTEYTISILSGNSSGYGQAKDLTFITLPTAPEVTIDSYTNSQMDVSWNDQKYATMYRVYDESLNELFETDKLNYSLKNLNAGQSYTLYISALNESGEGEKTRISQLTLPEVPTNIKVDHINDSSVSITWPKTSGADRYRIFHEEKEIDISEATVDLFALLSNQSYTVQVQAGNEAGYGELATVNFMTLPAEPKANIDTFSSNEIEISWDKQDNVSYRVYDVDGLLEEIDDLKIKLMKLKPGQTYSFWISAINKSGESSKAEVNQRTLPGGWDPKNPNQSINISDITTSSVRISWKAAEGAEYYEIMNGQHLLGTVKSDINTFVISDLESATTYSGYTLVAVNTAGQSVLKVPSFTTQAVQYSGTGTSPPVVEESKTAEEPEPVKENKPVPFQDIKSSFAQYEIEALYKRGIVNGRTETMYSPNGKVTRVEFASMLVRALELQEESGVPLTFEDVQRTAWYVPELGTAILNGVAKGFSDKEFRPQDPITREQASKMLSNSFYTGELTDGVISFKDADKIAVWAKPEVKALSDIAIVNGYPDGSFKPKRDLTRAECAVLIYRALIELHDGPEHDPIVPQE